MKALLEQIIEGKSLTEKQAHNMMNHLMDGEYTQAQIGAILVALRIKGETVDEITGCAKVMREKALNVSLPKKNVIDTCGTGGDGGLTYNVSTASSFILAAAGMLVAKHGNRSVSSNCGSADVLEKLGAKINLPPAKVQKCIEEIGIGYMFAPTFHTAMKHAIGPRRELKIRTIFNMLGPLTNPAKVKYQVIGVFDESLTNMFAQVLKKMGSKRALIVHGLDGMDEITLCDKTKVSELKKDGSIVDYTINPKDYGLTMCEIDALAGGDSVHNARIILDLFNGKLGARRDLLCLNAGAALYIADKAASIQEGITLACEIIDSGKAKQKLSDFIRVTNEA